VALAAWAGTPPAPYTGNADLAITNAIGGVGRTQGWTYVATTSGADVLADAQIPTAVKTDVEDPTVSSITRVVTVTLVSVSAAAAAAADAVCVRLGPTANNPALTCPITTASAAVTGGCYLSNVGDTCTFTIRPITQGAINYAQAHGPLWVMKSSGADANMTVAIGVAW
jgi:hypothetical protein